MEDFDFITDWDLDETKAEAKIKKRLFKFKEVEHKKLAWLKDIKLPKDWYLLKCITIKSFSPFTFIQKILQQEDIRECIILTYSINYSIIENLRILLKDWKIKNITLVINSLRYNENKDIMFALNWIKKLWWIVIFTHIHSKITLCKTVKNSYCIEWSWNMSITSKIEQYNIENWKATFDFHKNWIEEIEDFSTKKELIYL